MSMPKRFLFAMWDGGGNVPPAIGLVRRLVERGHVVRLLGDPTLAAGGAPRRRRAHAVGVGASPEDHSARRRRLQGLRDRQSRSR